MGHIFLFFCIAGNLDWTLDILNFGSRQRSHWPFAWEKRNGKACPRASPRHCPEIPGNRAESRVQTEPGGPLSWGDRIWDLDVKCFLSSVSHASKLIEPTRGLGEPDSQPVLRGTVRRPGLAVGIWRQGGDRVLNLWYVLSPGRWCQHLTEWQDTQPVSQSCLGWG